MNDNMSTGLYPQLPPQHNPSRKLGSRVSNAPVNPNILNPNQHQPIPPQPTMQGGPAFPTMQNFQAFPSYDMKDLAVVYGANMLNSGRDMVNQEVKNYLKMSRLQYYFAVDAQYVRNKLRLLFFPFTHSDWSVKYDKEEPIQPRNDINVPDLYIPVMAFVTYILLAGVVLGTQNRFTPEQLGLHASSVLAWTITEVVITVLTLYITNIDTKLTTIDLLAYSGYKYVGMITALLLSLAFQRTGYYVGLLYYSLSLAFFLVRSLKCKVLPERIHKGPEQVDGMNYIDQGTTASIGYKRGLYILLFVAGVQPLLMWWLSFHLVSIPTAKAITE